MRNTAYRHHRCASISIQHRAILVPLIILCLLIGAPACSEPVGLHGEDKENKATAEKPTDPVDRQGDDKENKAPAERPADPNDRQSDDKESKALADKASKMKAYEQKVPDIDQVIEMLPVPVGTSGDGKTYPATILMGSPKSESDRKKDEGPQFRVKLEPFWMGKTEITWDQFEAYRSGYYLYVGDDEKIKSTLVHPKDKPKERWIDAVSFVTPLYPLKAGPILESMGDKGGYPVADLSQYATRQFTKWLSKKTGKFYRLPTEAEWEYAARAGTKTTYFWGEDPSKLGDYGWFYDNSEYDDPNKGHPDTGSGYRKVGTKKPNAWGFYDMAGNVSEWVIDGYSASHYKQFAGKTIDFKDAIAWPKAAFPHVVKGGNWDADSAGCRPASRLASTPQWQKGDPQLPKSIWWYSHAFHVGFRIVRPLKEPSEAEKLRYWAAGTEDIEHILRTCDKQKRALINKGKDGKP